MYRDSPCWELKWDDNPHRQDNRRVGILTDPAGNSGVGKVQGRNTTYGAVSIWRRILKDCGGGRGSARIPGE